MSIGFLKLHRKILDWEWYSDINVSRLFMHLLLKANFEDKKWQGRVIKRGELVTSLGNLSIETGLTIQQVRTAINKLISTNEITSEATSQFTQIRLCNYSVYQDKNGFENNDVNTQNNNQITNQQQTDNKPTTNQQQTDNKRITTTKEDNKSINQEGNKIRSKEDKKNTPFAPLLLGEVSQSVSNTPTVTDTEGYGNRYRGVRYEIPKGTVTDTEESIIEPINESIIEPNIRETKKCKKNSNDYSEDFEDFWQQYPKKQAKPSAFKAYQKAIKISGKEIILNGAIFYNSECERKQTPEQYIKQASGWLNDQRYNDSLNKAIGGNNAGQKQNYVTNHQKSKSSAYSNAIDNIAARIADYEKGI
jgi:hypothetical protein